MDAVEREHVPLVHPGDRGDHGSRPGGQDQLVVIERRLLPRGQVPDADAPGDAVDLERLRAAADLEVFHVPEKDLVPDHAGRSPHKLPLLLDLARDVVREPAPRVGEKRPLFDDGDLGVRRHAHDPRSCLGARGHPPDDDDFHAVSFPGGTPDQPLSAFIPPSCSDCNRRPQGVSSRRGRSRPWSTSTRRILPAPEPGIHAKHPNPALHCGHFAMLDGLLPHPAGRPPAIMAPARVPADWHDSCMVTSAAPLCGAAKISSRR